MLEGSPLPGRVSLLHGVLPVPRDGNPSHIEPQGKKVKAVCGFFATAVYREDSRAGTSECSNRRMVALDAIADGLRTLLFDPLLQAVLLTLPHVPPEVNLCTKRPG